MLGSRRVDRRGFRSTTARSCRGRSVHYRLHCDADRRSSVGELRLKVFGVSSHATVTTRLLRRSRVRQLPSRQQQTRVVRRRRGHFPSGVHQEAVRRPWSERSRRLRRPRPTGRSARIESHRRRVVRRADRSNRARAMARSEQHPSRRRHETMQGSNREPAPTTRPPIRERKAPARPSKLRRAGDDVAASGHPLTWQRHTQRVSLRQRVRRSTSQCEIRARAVHPC